jgi:hypothetical protein
MKFAKEVCRKCLQDQFDKYIFNQSYSVKMSEKEWEVLFDKKVHCLCPKICGRLLFSLVGDNFGCPYLTEHAVFEEE